MNQRLNPYVGPRSFMTGEQLFGRERELNELLDLLIAERIVLLYAPSGSGKSSLVNAALIPAMKREGFTIRPVMRVSLEPSPDAAIDRGVNRYVLSCILCLDEAKPESESRGASETGRVTLSEHLGEPDGNELLIFDQFEEILTVDPTNRAAREQFFAQVGAALRSRSRWALFSMREEYVGSLRPYLRPIPTRLANAYRLDLLGVEAALASIRQPAQSQGVTFTDEAANKIIDDLRRVHVQLADGRTEEQLGQFVEPVQLQVVCYRLWEALGDEDAEITASDVAGAGDVNSALAGYYDDCLSRIAAETGVSERALRDWAEQRLITHQGIRGQVLQEPGQSGGLDNGAIRQLVNRHLVRAEKRRGATWFELAHDRLIDPVRSSNAAWREAHLAPLQKRAAIWDAQGRPGGLQLLDADLEEAKIWARAQEALTDVERAFLMQCMDAQDVVDNERKQRRRIKLLAVASSAVGACALVAGVFAVLQWREASRQAISARAGRLAVGALVSMDRRRLDLASLLSVEALKTAQTFEARNALFSTLDLGTHMEAYLDQEGGSAQAVKFSRDGKVLVSWTDGTGGGKDVSKFFFWNAANRRPLAPSIQPDSAVADMGLSSDGKVLVSTHSDGTLRTWDISARAQVRQTQGGLGSEESVAISRDGSIIATAGEKVLRLWHAGDLREAPKQLRVSAGPILSMAFSPAADLLAAGTDHGIIRLFDVRNSREIGALQHGKLGIRTVTFSGDGSRLASLDDESAQIWSFSGDSTHLLRDIRCHDCEVALNSNGRLLACSYGTSVKLVRLEPAQGEGMIFEMDDPPTDVAFRPADENTIASAQSDGTIRLWTLTPKLLGRATLPGDKAQLARDFGPAWGAPQPGSNRKGEAPHATFSGADSKVATGSADGSIWISKAVGGKAPARGAAGRIQLQGHTGRVEAVAFDQTGKILASGGEDKSIRIWDLASQRSFVLGTVADHVTSVAFNSGGDLLASGSEDGFIQVWNIKTRALLLRLHAQRTAVSALAFSPDGSALATGSRDGVVSLADLEAGALFGRNDAGADSGSGPPSRTAPAIVRVAFSHDGKALAGRDALGQVRFWNLDPDAWVKAGCELANRNLSKEEWSRYVGDRLRYHATCIDDGLTDLKR